LHDYKCKVDVFDPWVDHNEAKNDGEYIILEEEIEIGGIRLPKKRSWYYNSDQTYLGTDHLAKQNMDL
ncbi:MAG: DUF6503 family protein, partial [Flavobacteriaceae bacterium]